jgi:hypothetical protein
LRLSSWLEPEKKSFRCPATSRMLPLEPEANC